MNNKIMNIHEITQKRKDSVQNVLIYSRTTHAHLASASLFPGLTKFYPALLNLLSSKWTFPFRVRTQMLSSASPNVHRKPSI